MIAFACKQCNQRIERPESACGTLIFCTCGAGTRVPFESTLPPSAQPLNLPPRVERPADRPLARWGEEEPAYPEPRRWQTGPRDHNFCLNHPAAPTEHTCTDCGETFCSGCVVTFQGGVRCGPCKNFRVRAVQRPASISVMAILAPLVALGAGVLWLFVMLVVAGLPTKPGASAIAGTAIVGLFPQLLAFALGALALMKVESETKMSGRDMAITGMVSAVVCAALIVVLMLLIMQVAG